MSTTENTAPKGNAKQDTARKGDGTRKQADGRTVAAKDATNQNAVQAEWLKAQRLWYEATLTSKIGAAKLSVEDVAQFIAQAAELQVFKPKYRNLAVWIEDVCADLLTSWDSASKKLLARLLIGLDMRPKDVADLTEQSEASVSRAKNGKTPEPTTPLSRASKAVDGIADKCDDADKYPTADLAAYALNAIRSADKAIDQLVKRGYNVDKLLAGFQAAASKSRARTVVASSQGQNGRTGTATGTAPKPGQKVA